MARKEKYFTIEAKNRDEGKLFKITEMPSRKAEEWAIKVVCAIMGTETPLPESIMKVVQAISAGKPEDEKKLEIYQSVMASGIVALAKFGITALSKVPFDKSKPLMDEILSCVEYVADPSKKITIPLDDIHVEEASTWFRLKTEAFKLHVDFLSAISE